MRRRNRTKKSQNFAVFLCMGLLFCASLLLIPCFPVSANSIDSVFSVTSSNTLRRGETFEVSVSPAQDDIAAFVLFADFDPEHVTKASVELSAGLRDGYIYTSEREGQIAVTCAARKGKSFSANDTISFSFRTDGNTDAPEISVSVEVADAADSTAKSMLAAPEYHTVSASFEAAPASDCQLLSLTPPTGKITPAFSPDVYSYTLSVPFSTASVIFDTSASEGAAVQVNRKNLGAGGSTTDFVFTVTAADGVTRATYTVAVTRGVRGTSPTTAPRPTNAPRPAASSKSSAASSSSASPSSGSAGRGDSDNGNAEPVLDAGVGTEPFAGDAVNTQNALYISRAERFSILSSLLPILGKVMACIVFGILILAVWIRYKQRD